jgi:hypothetical protein
MHHSLTIDQDVCWGCTHCMKQCPTKPSGSMTAMPTCSPDCASTAGNACTPALMGDPHRTDTVRRGHPLRAPGGHRPGHLLRPVSRHVHIPHICQAIRQLGFTTCTWPKAAWMS